MNPKSIIVLVPEVKKREPKHGELFLTETYPPGVIGIAQGDNLVPDRIVYQVHEITPPEGATEAIIDWNILKSPYFPCGPRFTIPIPQPKTVKKWQWLYKEDGIYRLTGGFYATKEEAQWPMGADCELVEPFEESMIEVAE